MIGDWGEANPSPTIIGCPMSEGSSQPTCHPFHPGREDIDVRMLGEGRPFILEVHNARRRVPPAEQLQQLEARVAAVSGWVAAWAGGLLLDAQELH